MLNDKTSLNSLTPPPTTWEMEDRNMMYFVTRQAPNTTQARVSEKKMIPANCSRQLGGSRNPTSQADQAPSEYETPAIIRSRLTRCNNWHCPRSLAWTRSFQDLCLAQPVLCFLFRFTLLVKSQDVPKFVPGVQMVWQNE